MRRCLKMFYYVFKSQTDNLTRMLLGGSDLSLISQVNEVFLGLIMCVSNCNPFYYFGFYRSRYWHRQLSSVGDYWLTNVIDWKSKKMNIANKVCFHTSRIHSLSQTMSCMMTNVYPERLWNPSTIILYSSCLESYEVLCSYVPTSAGDCGSVIF